MNGVHYWQGTWIGRDEARARLDDLDAVAEQVLAAAPMSPLVVMRAGEELGAQLGNPDHEVTVRARGLLVEQGLPETEIDRALAGLAAALAREALERKVVRELGSTDPSRLARPRLRDDVYEAWVPVGLLGHVVPGNAPTAGVLSAVEGLLAGNVNVLKTSGGDTAFTAHVLAALAACDPSGEIAHRLVVLHFSSGDTDWLETLCSAVDAMAVWGGEEAVAGVAELVRPGCRLVDWGPKLSFAYLTAVCWDDDQVLRGLAGDVCAMNQQACSSPQVIYLDTGDVQDVHAFARRFAGFLDEAVPDGIAPLDDQEWAEITNTVLVAEHEEHLGLTAVHADDDGRRRIIVDTRPALRASPLHRTVWVKPLPRREILSVLRPMRRYLQTVGLGAERQDVAVLSRTMLAAGAQRISLPGGMLGSYHGEPHDGTYALQRYSRRVDVQLDAAFRSYACLDDLTETTQLPRPDTPITSKSEFGTLQSDLSRAEVFFRTGGTTGNPKLSAFSWADYHEHMRYGAEGLLAAGFDPSTDRTMNLFFGGQLYGGFASFFSVLDKLEAVQYPMAGQQNRYDMVAQSIVDNGVDTLLGMPTYLVRLFVEAGELLRSYGGVRKIFFGGEHFGAAQRRWLADEFGVEVVRSAAYGSVDSGPMGYQCGEAPMRVHHLFTGVQTLEIVHPEHDTPVEKGEVGRLVFTAHTRRGQWLERYEIGDLGRWTDPECPCGRRTPRFELLGRTGDVFRSGAHFLNYRRFGLVADELYGYAGQVQIVLDEQHERERLTIRLERDHGLENHDVLADFLQRYPELWITAERDRMVTAGVELCSPEDFVRAETSGKLVTVVDQRDRSR